MHVGSSCDKTAILVRTYFSMLATGGNKPIRTCIYLFCHLELNLQILSTQKNSIHAGDFRRAPGNVSSEGQRKHEFLTSYLSCCWRGGFGSLFWSSNATRRHPQKLAVLGGLADSSPTCISSCVAKGTLSSPSQNEPGFFSFFLKTNTELVFSSILLICQQTSIAACAF